MREEETPTYNRVGRALDNLVDLVGRNIESSVSGELNFSQMREMSFAMPLLVKDLEQQGEITRRLLLGLEIFEELAAEVPELEVPIADGVQKLLMSMFQLVSEVAGASIESEVLKIAPLAKKNKAKAAVAARACELAKQFWGEDEQQQIRISAMAARVYGTLHEEGFGEILPDYQDGVKDWIKIVAPEYARKGGKPRKTP